MMIPEKRKSIDLLIEQFWRKGYLTVMRKYGTYLPEPNDIGGFEVDVIARQKKDYAIGITLSPEDLNSLDIIERISYLATRQTSNTSNRVKLFIGIPADYIAIAKERFRIFPANVTANIHIVPIVERRINIPTSRERRSLFAV
jgi:hypothetical protein